MLTIRKEQFAVFEKEEIKKFEEPTYLHLNILYPERCQDIGEPKLRRMIQYGIKRAASHGIQLENDVRKYIEVMLVLGPDFDNDPHFPWAASILTDESLKDPKLKASRLHETAMKNLAAQL
jgi:hypothetical protein